MRGDGVSSDYELKDDFPLPAPVPTDMLAAWLDFEAELYDNR